MNFGRETPSNPTLGRHTKKQSLQIVFFFSSLSHLFYTSDVKIYILVIPVVSDENKERSEWREEEEEDKKQREESAEESGFSRGQCKATQQQSRGGLLPAASAPIY